jgi:hypothetical protein
MRKLHLSLLLICAFSFSAFAKIGIVVNKSIYPYIQNSITQYINDIQQLQNNSCWLNAITFDETNSVQQLKDSIAWHFANDNLEGVVFVGDLPIAQFEIERDYPGYAQDYGYALFPIDLYFMDLDGQWLDNAKNGDWNGLGKTGVFDQHTGSIQAEIWVSRIIGSVVPGLGSEADVINQYFSRVHRRMLGNDPSQNRYLILADDITWPWAIAWANASLQNYSSVITHLRSENADTRENLRKELINGYESAIIIEHSAETYHATSQGAYSNSDYLNSTTNTRFYNLFACSNARYTVPNFLGGLYAWGHNGLVSVGSTKSGSMLGFTFYYSPLGNDRSFGESYKEWFNNYVLSSPPNGDMISWHYGMTLCGVGTLHLKQENTDPEPAKVEVYLTPDNAVVGTTIQSDIRIVNTDTKSLDLSDLNCVYYTYDPSIQAGNLQWDHYYSSLGSGTVTASIEKLSQTFTSGLKKADTKITLSFSSNLTLAANSSMFFQGALHSKDWQYSFTESDDWSHFTQSNKLADNIVLFSKSQNKVIFGSSPEGTSSDYNLTISPEPVISTATITFNVTDASLAGQAATLSFRQNNVSVLHTTSVIAAGLNTVPVNFSSRFVLPAGSYQLVLTIDGRDVGSVSMTKQDLNNRVTVSPENLTLTTVAPGGSSTATFTITNNGNANAVISSIFFNTMYFTANETGIFSLTPGSSRVITVTFRPTAEGQYSDLVTIINAPDENIQTLRINLSGRCEVVQQTNLVITMNADGNVNGNSIQPNIFIKNIGTTSVNLADITADYYSYDPSISAANLACDIYYCNMGSIVSTSISKLPIVGGTDTYKADMQYRLTFSSGTLSPNQSVQINIGIHSKDWQYNFNEADDWSSVVYSGLRTDHIVIRNKATGQIMYGVNP